MLISVKANVRTAEASRKSLQSGLTIAFKSGAITGLLVAGLALLAITLYYIILINLEVENREIIKIRILYIDKFFCGVRIKERFSVISRKSGNDI